MRDKIIARYRIVTPMFIGDAEQKASGISPAPVKGALRFWWRALNWGRFLKEHSNNEIAVLCALHQQESELFGGLPETVKNEETGKDETKGWQGAFLLRVIVDSKKPTTLNNWPTAQSNSGYLGMGLWETNKQPHREAIAENQTFTVELRLKPDIQDQEQQSSKDALKLWGLIGGLGSRVRRGFGSIALENLNDELISFATKEAYWKAIIDLLTTYAIKESEPPFTAFSQHVMPGFSGSKTSARDAHEDLGLLFKNYRGQPSSLRGAKKGVFGLPYSGGTLEQGNARRASPLLFHIHPIGKLYQGLVLCLPATFHHQATLIKVDETLLSDFFKQLTVVA